MFGVGPEELMIIMLVALLVIGPERLPKVARDVGKIVGELRRTSDALRDDFLNADKYLEGAATSIATPAEAAAATPESTTDGPPGESAFDREMRLAKERLKET